jgi:hypothetical protein
MKNTIYLLSIALIMGACTYKNEPIKLKPYEANYKAPISKEKKAIFVHSVKDDRADKSSIGYALEDGERKITFFSNENFEKKYKDALIYALSISEFNTNVSQAEASEVIEIHIKNIKIVHTDKSFDENLKGELAVELVVKKGNTTTKYNFTQKAGKWISPSHNSKDVEPFLATLFADSIDAVVAKLVE